jgi:tRNA-specific adenosine deaminase 3
MWCGRVEARNLQAVLKDFIRILPLPKYLNHVKRVKKSSGLDSDGNIGDAHWVLLAVETDYDANDMAAFLIESRLDGVIRNVRSVDVPRYPARTRTEFDAMKQLWPIALNLTPTPVEEEQGYADEEIEWIQRHLMAALEQAQIAGSLGFLPIGCIIVDPSTQLIQGAAHDVRPDHLCRKSMCGCDMETKSTLIQTNPAINPLRHAVIECIDAVAEKQRTEEAVKRKRPLSDDGHRPQKSDLPYLCTTFDAYVTREPCVFCAMALLHSRIGRVFFIDQNTAAGGFSTHFGLHDKRKLNHRFRVFQCTL